MADNSLDSIGAGASSRHNIDEVFLDYSDFNRGAKRICFQSYIWMCEILHRGWICGSNMIKCFLSDCIFLRRFIHYLPQKVVIISILQYAAIKSDYFLFVLPQKITWEGTLNIDSLERACCKVSLCKKSENLDGLCRVFFLLNVKICNGRLHNFIISCKLLLPKSHKYLEKSHKIVSFWKSMLWYEYETKITCFLLIYRFWSSLGWILPIIAENFKNISPPKDYFLQGS